MHPRPGPAARAKLADARIEAVIQRVDAVRHIIEAGLRVMESPAPSLKAAEALLAQFQVLERVFDAAEAQSTQTGPSSTRRTRRARLAQA